MKIIVAGVGHVGLPAALILAQRGHQVVGLDVKHEVVRSLRRGVPHFFEPGLAELLRSLSGSVEFQTTEELQASGALFDAAVICVDTPTSASGQPDLWRLESAVALVVNHVAEHGHIALRSTVPPGTTARLTTETACIRPEAHLSFSHVPEFVRQGSALEDMENPWRIVIGVDTREAREAALRLVDHGTAPIELMGTRAAEMVKCAANTYLAMRVSYANLIAELSEALGADFDEVRRGLGSDPRIGSAFLTPGLGFGGPCLPKDLRSLTFLVTEAGLSSALFQATWDLNEHARLRLVDLISGYLRPGERVAVLGLTFKGGTDDLQHSPAMLLALELLGRGAAVVGFDPTLSPEADGHSRVPIVHSAVEAAVAAKAVVLAADWPEFSELDWAAIAAVAPNATVFDCRCVLIPEVVEASGLRYFRPGRGLGVGKEFVRPDSALGSVGRRSKATAHETLDAVVPSGLPRAHPDDGNRASQHVARVWSDPRGSRQSHGG